MNGESGAGELLLHDIARWRVRLPDVEPTYCQGIANKAAKQFEAMLKTLAADHTGPGRADLSAALARVKYTGAATTVEKLPFGTVVELLLDLAKQDPHLSAGCKLNGGKTLRAIVEARNLTTHELPPAQMREATSALLDLIEQLLTHPPFAQLVDERR